MQQEPTFEFINLNMIELNFNQGKYQTTFKLSNDVTKMWALFKRIFANDPDKIEKTNSFKAYFDEIIDKLNLVNKFLVTPQEPQPPVLESSAPALQASKTIGAQPQQKKIEAAKKAEKAMTDLAKIREKSASA